MAVTHVPQIHWKRADFAEMEARRSARRRRKDEKRLKEIFSLAADSPLMAEALAWAKDHDIKFLVDYKTDDLGYYMPGTGVLAISKGRLRDKEEVVDTIVHEIRHAWQDYHGFTEGSHPGFSYSFIQCALLEADASAFGQRAADQYAAAQMMRAGDALSDEFKASLADESRDLGEKFLLWFDEKEGLAGEYGGPDSKQAAKRYGLYRWFMPRDKAEFDSDVPALKGELSLASLRDVLQLGQNFSQTGNYLAHMQPDILPKQILRPSLADEFWGAATRREKKRTAKIRKAALQKQLKPENRKTPHPWS